MKSAHTLQVELTLAHGLALELARGGRETDALASAVDHARDLAFALDHTSGDEFENMAVRLGAVVTAILGSARTRDGAEVLCRVLVRARGRVVDLVRFVEDARKLSAMSCRFTEWAARLLPLTHRLEYAELFQSELHDLAQSGTSRQAQIRHALRVLARVPVLRQELRAPARERSW